MLQFYTTSYGYGGYKKKNCSEDSVTISGKFRNTSSVKDVKFYVIDYILGNQRTYYATIDSAGVFKVDLPLRTTTDIFWTWNGPPMQLLVTPGDSLHMEIDNNTVKYFGSNAVLSKTLSQFNAKLAAEFPAVREVKALSFEPKEYYEFKLSRLAQKRKFLQRYCSDNSCPLIFESWCSKNLEISYFDDLLAFSWRSNKYGLGSEHRLSKEDRATYDSLYFKSMNLNDSNNTLSSKFPLMLNGLSHRFTDAMDFKTESFSAKIDFLIELVKNEPPERFVGRNNAIMDSLKIFKQNVVMEAKSNAALENFYRKYASLFDGSVKERLKVWCIDRLLTKLDKIKNRSVRELIMCHYFFRALESNEDCEYYWYALSSRISNPCFREVLENEYKRKISEIWTSPDRIDSPVNLSADGDRIFNEVLSANRGNVILIDIWATWCGPCVGELKKMKTIEAKLAGHNIKFVYMCAESSFGDWKKLINKLGLEGKHIFLTSPQYEDLEKKFQINSFPTHLIVDKKGKIYNNISLANEENFIDRVIGLDSDR